MRKQSAKWIAEATGGELVGDPDQLVGPDIAIDSRKITPDAVFVAFNGQKVDGHDYAQAAVSAGAGAVVGTRETNVSVPQIIVSDPIEAISAIAKKQVELAKRAGLKVFGITGSAGKTSTKDLLAQILAGDGQTISPVGSFNNELGAPLTAAQVKEETRYLVSEMGARAVGDVAWLCSITPPDVSIVVNVGTAHIGEFGSRHAIGQAKGEIVECLPESGWAVLNCDDDEVAKMVSRTKANIGWFGLEGKYLPNSCQLVVLAKQIRLDELQRARFKMEVTQQGKSSNYPVELNLVGEHMVVDAIAAASAAIASGLDAEFVASQLSKATVRSPWRMELHQLDCGAVVLDDSYNANPDSMAAALITLGKIGQGRKHANPQAKTIAVLADMYELGTAAEKFHQQVGIQAIQAGVDQLITLGQYGKEIIRGAESTGAQISMSSVANPLQASRLIKLGSHDVVLVKASRAMSLEKVSQLLLAQDHTETNH